MFSSYLDIPVNFGSLIRKAEAKRVDLKQSIHHMIHLILTTSYGEVRYDPAFGWDIWQFDFETIYNPYAFREDLKASLQKTIMKHETRLANVSVDLQVEQLEVITRVRNKRVKTRIVLIVNGTIERTNESFSHREVFFIGPLSYS